MAGLNAGSLNDLTLSLTNDTVAIRNQDGKGTGTYEEWYVLSCAYKKERLCVSICVYVCMLYVYTCVLVYAYMYMCVHVYICMCTVRICV